MNAVEFLESQEVPTRDMNGFRMSVPAMERMKQLYAFGHTYFQICEILKTEFEDIDFNPITPRSIKKIVEQYKAEFENARLQMGLDCREAIQRQITNLFNIAQEKECKLVEVYTKKLDSALSQLADLDLDEKDEDGNYKNTSRVFVLLEMIEKLQSKVSKIVGTDALREIEVYRQKIEAKAAAEDKSNSLLPPIAKGSVVDEPKTKFI